MGVSGQQIEVGRIQRGMKFSRRMETRQCFECLLIIEISYEPVRLLMLLLLLRLVTHKQLLPYSRFWRSYSLSLHTLLHLTSHSKLILEKHVTRMRDTREKNDQKPAAFGSLAIRISGVRDSDPR
jgi:hypothetical protein